MYAVVETSGKQYQVKEGKYIDIDLLEANLEETVTFNKVVSLIAGDYTQIGQPYIEGASVQAKVLKHDKAKKVIIFKMRRKKGYRLKQGHRQPFTRILVENIDFPNKEETLNYVKSIEEKIAKEQEEQEAKIKEAIEKRLAEKTTKKNLKKEKQETIKEETKAEEIVEEEVSLETVTEEAVTEEIQAPVEATTEETEEHNENAESEENKEENQ